MNLVPAVMLTLSEPQEKLMGGAVEWLAKLLKSLNPDSPP